MPHEETDRSVSATGQTAIILAAGAGSRLGALGRRHSKATLPVSGQPLIAWVMESLRRSGIGSLIVVGHPSDADLARLLRSEHPHVIYVLQPERLGIADALRCALSHVDPQHGYLACACDSIFRPRDIAQLIAVGTRLPTSAAVGVLAMGASATTARSAVRLVDDRVIEIVEKPAAATTTSGLVAMPLYWLPHVFSPYLERVPALGNERYVSTALNEFIRGGGVVSAVPVSERIEVTTAADVANAAAQVQRIVRG
jgi:dTDP-glucose pyrophosphorylase